MGKRISFRVVLVAVIIFLMALSQLVPIAQVVAATLTNTSEFFTDRSNYCQNSAGNCDALLQWGIATCVYTAALDGDFESSAYKTAFNNATSNPQYESLSTSSLGYELLTDLLAYYYHVNATGTCPTAQINTGIIGNLPAVYSLDNIGAAFDMLQIVDGSTSNGDFNYSPSSGADGLVTLTDISAVTNDIVDAQTDLQMCQLILPESYNTGMDVSGQSFDIGETPTTGSKTMIGILNPKANLTTSDCGSATSNDFLTLIDTKCGNISDQTLPYVPQPQGNGTCSITSTADGNTVLQYGTGVTFYLDWKLSSPQAIRINSATVTSNLSSANVASPAVQGALTTSVGYTSSNEYSTTDSPVNPKKSPSNTTITYSGSMSVEISGTSTPITCTSDSVTWNATSGGCDAATAAATAALAALEAAEAVFETDETNLGNALTALSAAETQLAKDQAAYAKDPTPANKAAVQALQMRVNTDNATVTDDTNISDNISQRVAQDSTAYNVAEAAEEAACVACPPGETGTPPNCSCPLGEVGIPPNCTTPGGGGPSCPPGDTGIYPNCVVPSSGPTGPEAYFSVIGGDTIAGSGFSSGASCTGSVTNAGIVGSNSGSSSWNGASDNLSALAPDIISGFSTGSGGDALTFANTDTQNTTYGGSFGTTNGICAEDYYSTSTNIDSNFNNLTSATGSFNLSTIPNSSSCWKSPSSVYVCKLTGPVALSGTPPSKVVIYVSGNVEITGNISIYASDTSALTKISDIPLFYLISNGNIYIDSAATNIDGVYVAENLNDSNPSNNGIIYTCAANGGSPFASGSALISSCNNQLTVNGSLVASQIKFGRVYGDIGTSNSAAETINYGPEVWLSEAGGSSGSTTPDYQYITELSPVI